jgi:hypothetical protein
MKIKLDSMAGGLIQKFNQALGLLFIFMAMQKTSQLIF